ncbi:hypothetical protein AWW66_16775 [Micromonospora rosaria]|uniref:Glycosyltransferase RgtA/B/C/D-like domain-containing protein n=1 Tax=Micromonospora rosaria TaxID=47874 RepID=A0A136PQX4_9ACTN|nr:hypothetical protein AWW66_16775 [Micromonospora rosaria]
MLALTAAGGAAWWRHRRDHAGPAGATPGDAPPGLRHRLRTHWSTASRGERLLTGTVGGLLLVELVVALLAEPNNFDSQTYHLPKVEHWVQQQDLEFWPTAIHRQVTIPPGAEYLLLHLRLFTGSDGLHNLVQWAAGVLAVLVVARIAAQLGGGRRAQALAAFLLATTPMVTLQATSTQTDLMVAAWVACVVTLALDGLRRRSGPATIVALGAATGLTAITKTSGLIGAGPLLVLWGLAQLRLAYAPHTPPAATGPTADAVTAGAPGATATLVGSGSGPGIGAGSGTATGAGVPAGAPTDADAPTGPGSGLGATPGAGAGTATRAGGGVGTVDGGGGGPRRTARGGPGRGRQVAGTVFGSVAILLVAALVVGPFLVRVTAEFGHPLGPPRLRESIPMERHDPPSILVNALRIGHTALDTPLEPLRRAAASAIVAGAEAIGVDPQDRDITFGREMFPEPSWYPDEDRVAFPLAGTLILIALVVAVARPARILPTAPGPVRAYAAALTVTLLLHTSMIKWQPWGNRLLVYALTIAVPLAALWVDAVLRRRPRDGRRPVAAGLVVTVLATSALAGVLAVSYGFPRRLVGAGSVFTTSDWDTRFLRRPQWTEEFRWAAEAVRATDARRVGLVQQNDNWEYPWWLLLRDTDGTPPELVALQSVLPDRPPADPSSVDAIVCTGSRRVCTDLVPEGWRLEFRDYVGYALPPTP